MYIRNLMKRINYFADNNSVANKPIIWLFLLLLMLGNASAQAQAKFYASAPKSVPLNSNFQYSLTLENANGNNLKPPAITDFQILGGPNTSTSMQWINGTVTQSVTYSYVLHPKKEGTYKIAKATVTISGVSMESNELTIVVTPAAAQQQQTQRQRNPFDPFNDPFFNPGQQEEPPQQSVEELEAQLKDDVFIKLNVSKNSAYKGEMVTATYKLYFRQNLSGFNVTKAPTFDGYWSQEVVLDPNRRPVLETINGKQYNTVEIIKYNLYPQRAGALPISACEVNTVAMVQLRSKSRSPFDDFFNVGRSQEVPMTLRTASAKVAVKELPENGKPNDFSGAVGDYKFSASLSSKTAKTEEPIIYSIKISGTGNLKFVEAPPLIFPEAFEVYDPKTKETITNTASGMSGSKQYDYILMPTQPGDFILEPKTFSWFNPSSAKYYSSNSPEFAVKVTGIASKKLNEDTAEAKEVSIAGRDIRDIKMDLPVFKKQETFFRSTAFVGLYSAPFLLLIGLLAAKRKRETLASDIIGTKRRKAVKVAKKRLSLAEKFLARNEKINFYTEISYATWGYLGDKLNIDRAELSKDNVEEKLLAQNVTTETYTKLKNLLNTCEIALYSRIGEGSEMKQNYNLAVNLIADLEDEINEVAKPKTEILDSRAELRNFNSFTLFAMLLALSFASHNVTAQTPAETYKTAAQYYKLNEFKKAATSYDKLTAQGYKTAEGYYNLGNCYFRLNQLGKSILNYERALKLAPLDTDMAYNLNVVQYKLTDKILPVPQLAIVKSWSVFLSIKGSKGWAVYSLLAVWLGLLFCVGYLFVYRQSLFLYLGALSIFISILFISLAYQQSNAEQSSTEAILLVAETKGKSAPNTNSVNVFTIHEGLKFETLDQAGSWTKIRLADGKIGWIEKGVFERI